MMVPFKRADLRETEKAVGIRTVHNDVEKILWFPKSVIENKNGWRVQGFIDVPDFIYDKKIEEAFLS